MADKKKFYGGANNSFSVKKLSEASFIEENYGYRELGTNQNIKGLSLPVRKEQLKLAFSVYVKNGLGKRIIEVPTDFLFAEGIPDVTFTSPNSAISEEKLKKIDKLIKDFKALNELDEEKFIKFNNDLYLNGMLIVPVANSNNGDVMLGFIDPKALYKAETLPHDVTKVVELKFNSDAGTLTPNTSTALPNMKVIRRVSAFEEPDAIDYNLLRGDAFFFSVNNVSNQPEGMSDLIHSIDLLNALEDFIFQAIVAARIRNLFVADVTLTGYSEPEVVQWSKDHPFSKNPGRFVHNDKVKQELTGVSQMTSTNDAELIRAIKNYILGNYGYPPMWFADGEDANKATAVEQGSPMYKKLQRRQQKGNNILKSFYLFQIHQAILYKEGFNITVDEIEDLQFEFKNTPIDSKGVSNLANAFGEIVDALVSAIDNNLLTTQTASKIVIKQLKAMGIEIDEDTEWSELESRVKELENADMEDLKNRLLPNEQNPNNNGRMAS